MKYTISIILSSIFYAAFFIIISILHIPQVIAFKIGGYKWHKVVVDFLNLCVYKSIKLCGASLTFNNVNKIPTGKPIIIISNHQSQYDISPIAWSFRKHHPKFISKIELSKGIPSISFNLRNGGSAIIDRKNGGQSIKAILTLGKLIEENNYSACIFPEGTRSKTGKVRSFQTGGVKTLLKAAPSSIIVPVAIKGSNLLEGAFPIPLGHSVSFTVLDAINQQGRNVDEVVKEAELAIKKELGQD